VGDETLARQRDVGKRARDALSVWQVIILLGIAYLTAVQPVGRVLLLRRRPLPLLHLVTLQHRSASAFG